MPSRKKTKNRKAAGGRRGRPKWLDWTNQELLDLRFCDLDLTIEGTPLEQYIEQVLGELKRRGMRFRPHFWLSEEWFSPEGVGGVAIPFYLAHPRLTRLERHQMLEVEGATRESCLKILRHEIGHAFDHAYNLHRRKHWQKLFGKSSKPYPESYKPRPYSRQYVVHLDAWYAQSHPDEDFAETFAVWLKPRAIWRKRYHNWPALKKLEYVDDLMDEIAEEPAVVRTRQFVEPLSTNRRTLREYYEQKRERYTLAYPDFFDEDLLRLFSDEPGHAHLERASKFLREMRGEIRRQVSRWTGEHQYTLDQVLNAMIGRCRELKLRVVGDPEQVKLDFAILLTVQTMSYLFGGRHRIEM